VAGETLTFDIFARLREDGFAKAGKAATAASEDVDKLAVRLDKLGAKSTEARVKLTGNKEALAQLDALNLKLLKVGERAVNPEIDVKGAAKAQAEIAALEVQLDKLGKTSKGTTGFLGSGGLAGPAGMGALIAAGVALSPIIATVATGVGAFGLAAAGAVGPVLKAAQATGGLSANMAKLDPEQQKLARSILGLGKQYDAFQKALEPEVLNVFDKGIRLAGNVMHDVQPIAAATGKALGSMLSAIDAEFKSGTWQSFFAFMARTAGPDIQLITNNFTDLMKILPGLLQDLQPVASGFLQLTDDVLKLAGAIIKISDAERHLASAAHNSSGFLGELAHAAERAVGQFIPGIPAAQHLGQALARQADSASKAAPGIKGVGDAAAGAQQPVFNLSAAVDTLTASMDKNIGTVLTLQGDEISWQQSLQAATKQLDSNSAGLRGNSKDALANKAAVLQATQNVVTFADDQLKLGHNLDGASGRIQDQIHWLQIHGGKSAFATREIHALRMEEDKLKAAIHQKMIVDAAGHWSVAEQKSGIPIGGGNRIHSAQGAFITGGIPNQDSVPIMAMPGELVVPVPIVASGLVDHLRGLIPGFAAGGVVGSYSGSVTGEAKWLARQDAATLRALDVATAAATTAGIKAAQSAAASSGGPGMPGPGGGAPSANAALARKLYPAWGSGAEWNAWNSLNIRESGWSNTARNPSSGAYGIPQALPPSKMGAAANPPQSNPTAQIRWQIGYIKGRPGYGDPIGAWGHEVTHGWYAQGGVVGGKAAPVDPQKKKWLAQLARDVKVLEEDQKAAAKRRRILRHSVEIDELWFLTHPNVRKHGIGWDEHERALRNDRRRLSGFNRQESDKEKALAAKIAILRDLTGFPKGAKYGGPGTPAPPGDGGAGAGGGDTGGGTASAPSGPPPIPPPPMPAWMVAAGLGGSTAATGGFSFPSPVGAPQAPGGGMGLPEPVMPRFGGGSRFMGGGALDLGDLIAAIQAMHQGVVGAVGRSAPVMARGVDQSLNSMAARVSGRFT